MFQALRSLRMQLVQPVLDVCVRRRRLDHRLRLPDEPRLREFLSDGVFLLPVLLGLGMLRLLDLPVVS